MVLRPIASGRGMAVEPEGKLEPVAEEGGRAAVDVEDRVGCAVEVEVELRAFSS